MFCFFFFFLFFFCFLFKFGRIVEQVSGIDNVANVYKVKKSFENLSVKFKNKIEKQQTDFDDAHRLILYMNMY